MALAATGESEVSAGMEGLADWAAQADAAAEVPITVVLSPAAAGPLKGPETGPNGTDGADGKVHCVDCGKASCLAPPKNQKKTK